MSIGILSWGAHKTLMNTLDSYNREGLYQIDDDITIFFQDMTEEDELIAKSCGFKYFGASNNAGIAEGYKRLVEQATGEFFLFLENDWLLLRPPHFQVEQAKYLLEGGIDIVRFRDREDPGNPLWTRQFEFRELEGLTHLLDCVHWRKRPDRIFPEYIKRIQDLDEWFMASSKNANWTNNPHMARTEFLKEYIVPHMGDRDGEIDIQNWWQEQNFKVAQGEGLFKHWRLD